VLTNGGAVAVANHGGLMPPALVPTTTTVCRKNDDFCDAETHVHKSGGRQPAVGMSNAIAIADAFVQRPASARRRSETAFATATRWTSAFRVRILRTSHGGLTPPALGAERTFAGEKTIFAMQKRTFPRAAGVSPPWYRKTHLQRRVIFVEWLRLPLHNRLPNRRGAYAPLLLVQSGRLPAKNDFCDARTHVHKSGGRQSAVGVSNAIAIAGAFVRRPASARRWSETTFATATRRISTFRVHIPSTSHGELTPPRSWFTVYGRRANGDFCDARTHIHMSGGRQPAVGVHWVERSAWCAANHLQARFSNHGGLTPPCSWCSANVCRRKNDLCDARTHIRWSGGRQPAVGVSNAIAIADAFVRRPASAACRSETTFATATRWISAFRVRIPRTSHGGLTPPALGAERTFAGKKTIFAMHKRTCTRAAGGRPGCCVLRMVYDGGGPAPPL
jgi:hypothetical protein